MSTLYGWKPLPHYDGGICNRWFPFKTCQMFFVHPTPVILDLCMKKTRSGKSHAWLAWRQTFWKRPCFPEFFRLHDNQFENPPFSNSSVLKSVFENFRFRYGLFWTVGRTIEIKLRFQFFLKTVDTACLSNVWLSEKETVIDIHD